jgi:hypothetical protein
MATRALSVPARDVVFLKGIVEAHDGLAAVFSQHGGELILAAPLDREAELDELACDLMREFAPWTCLEGDAPATSAATSSGH